jgi:hypothetical protein
VTFPAVPLVTTGELIEASDWNAINADLAAFLSKYGLYLDGGALRPDLTNGCDPAIDATLTAGHPLLVGCGFSGTVDQFAQFKVPLPKAWNAGTITFRVRWSAIDAGAGNVVWSLAGVACSDGDSIDVAFGTAQTITDAFQAVKLEHITAESAAITIAGTPAKQDTVYFRVGRLATNGSDTKAEKVYLLGIEIFITVDAPSDV